MSASNQRMIWRSVQPKTRSATHRHGRGRPVPGSIWVRFFHASSRCAARFRGLVLFMERMIATSKRPSLLHK